MRVKVLTIKPGYEKRDDGDDPWTSKCFKSLSNCIVLENDHSFLHSSLSLEEVRRFGRFSEYNRHTNHLHLCLSQVTLEHPNGPPSPLKRGTPSQPFNGQGCFRRFGTMGEGHVGRQVLPTENPRTGPWAQRKGVSSRRQTSSPSPSSETVQNQNPAGAGNPDVHGRHSTTIIPRDVGLTDPNLGSRL